MFTAIFKDSAGNAVYTHNDMVFSNPGTTEERAIEGTRELIDQGAVQEEWIEVELKHDYGNTSYNKDDFMAIKIDYGW